MVEGEIERKERDKATQVGRPRKECKDKARERERDREREISTVAADFWNLAPSLMDRPDLITEFSPYNDKLNLLPCSTSLLEATHRLINPWIRCLKCFNASKVCIF